MCIRDRFIRIFEEEARKLEGIDFLAQGTIYPDIVESGTKTAKVVKSHHNVGGLPEDLKFQLVEPLRQLFKDEVRQCGVELGLPDEMVSVSYTHLDVYKRQASTRNQPRRIHNTEHAGRTELEKAFVRLLLCLKQVRAPLPQKELDIRREISYNRKQEQNTGKGAEGMDLILSLIHI